jgi:hypothetical protein
MFLTLENKQEHRYNGEAVEMLNCLPDNVVIIPPPTEQLSLLPHEDRENSMLSVGGIK